MNAANNGKKGKGGKSVFDGTFFAMLGLLVLLAALAYAQGGTELVRDGLGGGFSMLQKFALLFVVAFLVAGLAEKIDSARMGEQNVRRRVGHARPTDRHRGGDAHAFGPFRFISSGGGAA